MKKVRVFVLDSRNANPIEGIPFQLKAIRINGNGDTTSQELFLGILSSDHKGYLSFALPDLEINWKYNGIYIWPLFFPESEDNRWSEIENNTGAIPFLIDGSLIPSGTINTSLPSIQYPDSTDWQLSPESFGSSNYSLLGQGGCEEILLSNVSVLSYRFSQIIRDANFGIKSLNKLAQFQPCETDLSAGSNEFSDWGNVLCYRMGAYLEYDLTWKPINHGLGQVLYSLPLAPCETVKIAMIDWSRNDASIRGEDTSFTEQLLHNQRRDRVIDETVQASIREWQRGGSIMGGLSIAGNLGNFFSGALGLGGGYSTTSGNRNISAETVQKIADNIAQASSSSRRFNSTVVVQASQAENETLQTRSVTNHNHCHALTVLYYEVVRHFLVSTSMLKEKIRDIILIRYPISSFLDPKKILANKTILIPALLDESLKDCFKALEREYCVGVNFSKRNFPVAIGEEELMEITTVITTGDIGLVDGHGLIAVKLITHWNSEIPLNIQDALRKIWGPAYGNSEIGGDRGVNDSYVLKPKQVDIFTLKPNTRVRWKDIAYIKFTAQAITGDRGSYQWSLGKLKMSTQNGDNNWILFDSDVNSIVLNPGDSLNPPLQVIPVGPRSPEDALSDSDLCCKQKLIDHINANLAYYNRVLWLNEDPEVRAVRFDQYEYVAPPLHTNGSIGHPGINIPQIFRLIDVIENRIVGFAGDYVAFPFLRDDNSTFISSAKFNKTESNEQIISVPTRGAFAEAKLGHCNSCETRDVTRFWDWKESPCDCDGPNIADISAGSRAQSPLNTTPNVPAASLNVAPVGEEPDPAGMKGALDVLKASGIFEDMSGKEQVAAIITKLIDSATQLRLQELKNQHTTAQNSNNANNRNSNSPSNTSTSSAGNSSPANSGSQTSAGSNIHDMATAAEAAVRRAGSALSDGQQNQLRRQIATNAVDATNNGYSNSEKQVTLTLKIGNKRLLGVFSFMCSNADSSRTSDEPASTYSGDTDNYISTLSLSIPSYWSSLNIEVTLSSIILEDNLFLTSEESLREYFQVNSSPVSILDSITQPNFNGGHARERSFGVNGKSVSLEGAALSNESSYNFICRYRTLRERRTITRSIGASEEWNLGASFSFEGKAIVGVTASYTSRNEETNTVTTEVDIDYINFISNDQPEIVQAGSSS